MGLTQRRFRDDLGSGHCPASRLALEPGLADLIRQQLLRYPGPQEDEVLQSCFLLEGEEAGVPADRFQQLGPASVGKKQREPQTLPLN